MSAMLPSGHLAKRFHELLECSDSVDVAVAWITSWKGLDDLLELARRFGNKRVRVVVGVADYITSPRALRQMDLNADLRIYETRSGVLFHPKIYIFSSGSSKVCWVGSANLTRRAFHENIEAVMESEDSDRTVEKYFCAIWHSPELKRLKEFDIVGYEEKWKERRLSRLWQEPEYVEPDDEPYVPALGMPIRPKVRDVLRSPWLDFLAQLKEVPNLSEWVQTLEAGASFAARDWDKDLTEREKMIMFGHVYNKESFAPFGKLRIGHAKRFMGDSLAAGKNRIAVGEALGEVAKLKTFDPNIVQKSLENLRNIDGCGNALATRLLVLARPDWFVVVNLKSFRGLSNRFKLPVQKGLKPKHYATLIAKIQEQDWWQSSEPSHRDDRQLWRYRAALIDPLVYDDTGNEFAD